MRFRLKDKSFAEKMADKKKLIKQYGKSGLKLYNELSSKQEISQDELFSLLGTLGIPNHAMDFLLEQGVLEKIEEAPAAPPTQPQQELLPPPPKQETPPSPPIQPSPEPPKLEPPAEPPKPPAEEPPLVPEPQSEKPPMDLSIAPELPQETTKQTIAEAGSPVERTVKRKYGDAGVMVLNLVQQGKTVKEIASATSLPLEQVVEIVDFLKAMGLVQEEEQSAPRFSPLIEAGGSEVIEEVETPIEDEMEAYKYIGSGGLEKYTVGLDLALKYGKEGRVLFEHMLDKQEKDLLDLVVGLKIPMKLVREVMDYLAKKKLVEKRMLSRQEVRKKYGYDAFAIYKRFGSKGVLFYKMLGGDYSTRESIKMFAKLTGEKDPEKILEIMKMVHSILGLTIPISRETIAEILQGD